MSRTLPRETSGRTMAGGPRRFVTVVLTASLLSGRSSVSALATWTRIIVGVLMLASLLAALAGVFLSTGP